MSSDGGFPWGSGKPKREPNADMRIVANAMREFYQAQLDAGFGKGEAMQLTLKFLEVSLSKGIDQQGDDDG